MKRREAKASNGHMKAVVSSATGALVDTVAIPVPAAGQVLTRVRAAGVNRADLNAARGMGVAAGASLGRVLGMDWTGEVVDVGSGVTRFVRGDRIMALGTGAYAEYAVSHEAHTVKINCEGFEHLASMLALATAHDAVTGHGHLSERDIVLVHGASSTVGLAALQISKLLGVHLVIGTSSHPIRRAMLMQYGADISLDPAAQDWPDTAMSVTAGHGADLIVDMVSGRRFALTMRAAAVRGRIINVGRLDGIAGELDFDLHALRQLTYTGVTFRTRSAEDVTRIIRSMVRDILSEDGIPKVSLPVDRAFPLEDAAAAHEYVRSNSHFGKVILLP
jgi:NADPH2:quinone reductase